MKPTKQIHQHIIDLCKKNDAKAQMQLYSLYCKAMFLVANRYVNDDLLAEDCMQMAFIKAFKKIESYRNEVPFGAWLKRIVINQSIDQLKKKKLELVEMNETTLTIQDDHDWTVDSAISVDDVVDAINNLKEKYRLVVKLYLLEGYDHQEIAEILNITENTSRTHLLRGKKLVREQLQSKRYEARY